MGQAIIWTNVDLIHWRMYAAFGGNELSHQLTSDILLYIHTMQWKSKEFYVINICTTLDKNEEISRIYAYVTKVAQTLSCALQKLVN